MFKFSIEIDEKKFLETLKIAGAEETYSKLSAVVASKIKTEVMKVTPVAKYGGGTMRRTWIHTPELQIPSLTRNLTNQMPYAVYLEEGTRDHGPVNAKALSWEVHPGSPYLSVAKKFVRTTSKMVKGKALKNPATDFRVFFKRVRGIKPKKMLENTLTALKPWVEEQLTSTINRIWSGQSNV